MLRCCQLDPQEQTSLNFLIKIQKKCIHENVSEYIVCEMPAILSRRDELRYISDEFLYGAFTVDGVGADFVREHVDILRPGANTCGLCK